MGVNGVVLLVGEGAKNSPQLLQWLKGRGCRCQAVKSCEDACKSGKLVNSHCATNLSWTNVIKSSSFAKGSSSKVA